MERLEYPRDQSDVVRANRWIVFWLGALATGACGYALAARLAGEHWGLGGFALGDVSMATAVFGLLLGLATVAAAFGGKAPTRLVIGTVSCVVVGVAAVGWFGFHIPHEDPSRALISPALSAAGSRSFLEISPTSTVTMLVLAAALLAIVWGATTPRQPPWGWMGVVLLVFVAHTINAVGEALEVSLWPIEGAESSLIASVVFLLLALALFIRADADGRAIRFILGLPPVPRDEQTLGRREHKWIILVFLAAYLAIGAGGAALLGHRKAARRREVTREMVNVTRLKEAQILAWRRERLADTQTLAGLPFLQRALSLAKADPWPPQAKADFEGYLTRYRRAYRYESIRIVGASGQVLLATPPETGAPEASETRLAEDAMLGGQLLTSDLRWGPGDELRLDLASPVVDPAGRPEGAVLLCVDATSQLLPIVETWPVESASAETLLLRRDGLKVTYLSRRRSDAHSASNFQLPLGQRSLAGAKAVVEDLNALSDGVDWRGVPVVWLARKVGDTTWVILAKMSRAEAYAAVRTEAWGFGGVLMAGMSLLGLVMSNYWRNRRRDYEQQEQEAERERLAAVERLALVMRHANDAILLFNGDMRIVEANDRVQEMYGRTPLEMRNLSAEALRVMETQPAVQTQFALAQNPEGVVFETEHVHQDGHRFPVEVSSRPVQVEGQSFVLSIVRDITQRKQQEQEIARLGRFYFVISQVNQGMVLARNREELFGNVCRVLVETGQFCLAWIGWREEGSDRIVPVAVAGDRHGYVKALKISTDSAEAGGRGPAGRAFREGKTQVINDFHATPGTEPWRHDARRSGLEASIAMPLRHEGQVGGVLTVYAASTDAFRPKEIALLEEVAGNLSFALDVFAGDARRQAAEAAVRASEGRLHFLMTATPVVIYSLQADAGHTTTFISDNVQSVLGYAPEIIKADPQFWASRLHPEDLPKALAAFAVLQEKGAAEREYRFRHADGTWRWMHDETRAVRDRDGTIREYVGFWVDVSSRREAERVLQAREEVFSNIVGQAVDAIVLVDGETGRFLEFNRASHEGLGYTREEFAQMGIDDIQAQHSPDDVRRNMEAIGRRGEAVFETFHRHRDGTLINVRVSARLLHLQGRKCMTAIWSDITEAKRVESELRKLSLAVEQSPISIVITDLDGAIEYVNPRFSAITGYSFEEVRGQNPRVLKSGQTTPEVYVDLWATITAGKVWRGEIINRKKSGETFIELVVITPVRNAQGTPTHFLALKEDITERVSIERRLRQLSRAIDQTPLSVVITDLTGAIEYVNPAFLAITGYQREEVIGQNPRVLKSGQTPPETFAAMWQTLGRGEVWRGELVNRKKNGELYVERAVLAPIADEAGRITHYVAIKEDVTLLKRTEEALRESQERYRLIAENTDDVIWIYDLAAARFTYCSPSVQKLRGYRATEVLEQRLEDVLTPESADYVSRQLPQRLQRFAAGDHSVKTALDQIGQTRRDGGVVATEVVSTILTDETNGAVALLGVSRDISERKRAEAALREREQRYRDLFDLESDTIFLLETETGRILQANQAASAMYGYSVAELETMRNVDLSMEPDKTLQVTRPDSRAPNPVVSVDHRMHRRKDGTAFPVEINLRFFNRDGGSFYLAAIRDITERVRAEEALRVSRDRLAKAEHIAKLGNWELDLATGELEWSDEMFRLLGLDPASVRPSTELYHSFMPAEDRQVLERRFAESLTKGERFVLGSRLITKSGQEKFVEGTGEFVRAPDGRVIRAIGTVQDITDRKLVEMELHELVKGLRALHQVSKILQQRVLDRPALLSELVQCLPAAMRDVEQARAAIEMDGAVYAAGAEGPMVEEISAPIVINDRVAGAVKLGYVHRSEPGSPAAFLDREREMLDNVALTIGIALGEREAFAAVERFSVELEDQVARRTAELAARNREMRALLDAIPDMVLHIDRDGRVISSQQAKDASSVPLLAPGEMMAGEETPERQLHGFAWALGLRALASRVTIAEEVALTLPNEVLMLELRAAPGGDNDVVVFVRDVTTRRKLENDLIESRDRVALAAGAGGVGIWDYDIPTGRLVWDEQMLRLHGIEAGDFDPSYAGWKRGLHPDDQARVEAQIREALDGTRDFDTEFRVVWPDGSVHDIRASAQVHRDAAGHPLRMIGTNWDITAQKRLAAETAAMLNREREISEMKTRFISVTSHEFRTPMSAALGSVELLRNHYDRMSPAKRAELYQRVFDSMHRMTEMLDDILTLNRMESKRMEATLVPVNLPQFAQSIIDEARLADQAAHRFELQVTGDGVEFVSDPNLLRHVYSNLLSNAARYSPAGKVVLTELRVEAEGARLAVTDQGIGIPEADRERIFEPFERGSNVGTIKGTGLGLNIVQRMVELLHGTIGVEAPAEGGSRFILQLPRLADSTSLHRKTS